MVDWSNRPWPERLTGPTYVELAQWTCMRVCPDGTSASLEMRPCEFIQLSILRDHQRPGLVSEAARSSINRSAHLRDLGLMCTRTHWGKCALNVRVQEQPSVARHNLLPQWDESSFLTQCTYKLALKSSKQPNKKHYKKEKWAKQQIINKDSVVHIK